MNSKINAQTEGKKRFKIAVDYLSIICTLVEKCSCESLRLGSASLPSSPPSMDSSSPCVSFSPYPSFSPHSSFSSSSSRNRRLYRECISNFHPLSDPFANLEPRLQARWVFMTESVTELLGEHQHVPSRKYTNLDRLRTS